MVSSRLLVPEVDAARISGDKDPLACRLKQHYVAELVAGRHRLQRNHPKGRQVRSDRKPFRMARNQCSRWAEQCELWLGRTGISGRVASEKFQLQCVPYKVLRSARGDIDRADGNLLALQLAYQPLQPLRHDGALMSALAY